MAIERENSSDKRDPRLSVVAPSPAGARATDKAPPDGRAEAQLRARIDQLESALAHSADCLEDSERRAAELLGALARVKLLEDELATIRHKLELIVSSKSWRLTTPLRRVRERGRLSVQR